MNKQNIIMILILLLSFLNLALVVAISPEEKSNLCTSLNFSATSCIQFWDSLEKETIINQIINNTINQTINQTIYFNETFNTTIILTDPRQAEWDHQYRMRALDLGVNENFTKEDTYTKEELELKISEAITSRSPTQITEQKSSLFGLGTTEILIILGILSLIGFFVYKKFKLQKPYYNEGGENVPSKDQKNNDSDV